MNDWRVKQVGRHREKNFLKTKFIKNRKFLFNLLSVVFGIAKKKKCHVIPS